MSPPRPCACCGKLTEQLVMSNQFNLSLPIKFPPKSQKVYVKYKICMYFVVDML